MSEITHIKLNQRDLQFMRISNDYNSFTPRTQTNHSNIPIDETESHISQKRFRNYKLSAKSQQITTLKNVINNITTMEKIKTEAQYQDQFIREERYKLNLSQKGFKINKTFNQYSIDRIRIKTQQNEKTITKSINSQKKHMSVEKQVIDLESSSPENKIKTLKLSRQRIYNQFKEQENLKMGKIINLSLIDDKDGAILEVFQHQEGSFMNQSSEIQEPTVKKGKARPAFMRQSQFISNNTIKQISQLKFEQPIEQTDQEEPQIRKPSRKSPERAKTEYSSGFTQFYENACLYRVDTNGDNTLTNKQKKLRSQQIANQNIQPDQNLTKFSFIKKQVDKELMHLLVLCWSKEGEFQPPPKKEEKKLTTLKQQTIMSKFRQISNSLLKFLLKMNRCKIKNSEIIAHWNKINIKRPYQNDGSFYFIRAVKFNCFEKVNQMIQKYGRYFVFDFDHIGRTALHIACSQGHTQIIHLLLEQGADTEAEDFLGRTSLYYAAKANQKQAVIILLKNKCNPFSKILNYRKLAIDDDIRNLISITQRIHIIISLAPPKMRNWIFEKKLKEMQQKIYTGQ